MKKRNTKHCADFHKRELGGMLCIWCNSFKCGKTYEEKLQEKIDAVPQEQKQKLLDLVWSGLALGEAARQSGFDTEVGVYAKILADNIGVHHYLRTQAV